MKKCPYCAKEIQDEARVCRYCKSDLTLGARPGQRADPKISGRAVASLFFGIFFFFLPASLAAVVFGHLSLSEIGRSGGRLKGQGMASAGLLLGYLGIPISLLITISNFSDLSRSKMAVNQASAVWFLRTLNTAARTYSATYNKGFPAGISALGPPHGGAAPDASHAGLIDEVLANGTKSGYIFTYTSGGRDADGRINTYAIHADPTKPGSTGQNHYFTDQTGVIRQETVGPGSEQSPPIVE